MDNIYLISGLGADTRLYKHQVSAGLPVKALPWILPEKNESIESYAKRMSELIPKEEYPVVLGGVSFGGILAIEMSKIIPVKKVIIISSIKTRKELPWRVKIWKYIPVYKFIPAGALKKMAIMGKFMLGKSSDEELDILLEMLKDTPPSFLKWGIHNIVNWKNDFIPENLTHIHGTSDYIFPINIINERNNLISIDKGTHIMIVTKQDVINPFLNQDLFQ